MEIKKYANTHFVNVIVEKLFYEEFEKTSSKLGVPTEISILKALRARILYPRPRSFKANVI